MCGQAIGTARSSFVAAPRLRGLAAPGSASVASSPRRMIPAAVRTVVRVAVAVGDAMVTVEAFDAAGETARQTYTLHVIPM